MSQTAPPSNTTSPAASLNVDDAARLAAALRSRIEGEVHFDHATRAMYATDASNYRQTPIGVVYPTGAEDVRRILAACREHQAPVLTRGGGTSLAGQACNAAVILDFSRHMNRVLAIDPEARTAVVQPGTILDDLRAQAEKLGLTFGPDPSTHAWCTLGGMIGNNSCGVHSLMAGKTVDNVERLNVITYDGLELELGPMSEQQLQQQCDEPGRRGELFQRLRAVRDDYAEHIRQRFPDIPRRVSGYNLDELLPERGFHAARALVGSEGTCAVILQATVRLVPHPSRRALLVIGYDDVFEAADDVPWLLEHKPIGLEGMDDFLVGNMRAKGVESRGVDLLPEGRGWLFVEFGADDQAEAIRQAEALQRAIEQRGGGARTRLLSSAEAARPIWAAREAGLGASARLADGFDTYEGCEDAAVAPENLGRYLRDFKQLIDEFGYRTTLYGHFGQGLVHTRIDFDLAHTEGVRRFRAFMERAADLVVAQGGSISGEHGDGQARAELLPRMFGPELIEAFQRFKAAWDPLNRLNPGKLVDPNRLDQNLRIVADRQPPKLKTWFSFPNDEGSFLRAVGRCIGVGKCRRQSGGTMCPSYMATHDEKHSTRGRAHLLYEMAEGNLPDGWQEEGVKEALDLCLSCKGCKHDCPASVDMASYKAEFLAHYYEKRRRPRQAYIFGYVQHWLAIASKMPRLINLLANLPVVSTIGKRIAGIAVNRQTPRLATRTFRHDCTHEQTRDMSGGKRVILWVDTFNNHLDPNVLHAGLAVLKAAGYQTTLPPTGLCCGRPLYDFGFLEKARRQLQAIVSQMGEQIDAGLPLVALEPSCLAVFRDELTNLLPDEPRAHKLAAQSYTLAEFLNKHAPDYQPPQRTGQALFHAHCHQKALMGTEHDLACLSRTGLSCHAPELGCCGMAGSFGFHEHHEPVSQQIAELAVLPAIRRCDEQTLLISDGFSCREQVRQATGKHVHHLAEILAEKHG